MRAIARAKINLMLRVTGVRDDGYHEIESIGQTLELHDVLDFTPAQTTAVGFTGMAVALEGPDLVTMAIDAYCRASGTELAFEVTVEKAIPSRAGLGGGSADAAAALLACDAVADAPLGPAALEAIGGTIGADVPFCIRGGAAAMRGTGEYLSAMPNPALHWVICVPPRGLSTADVYARLDETGRGSAPSTPQEWDAYERALDASDLSAIAALMHNDLTEPAIEMMPELGAVLEGMRSAGALGAVMTGSGSAVCGLCSDAGHAMRVAGMLDPGWGDVIVTTSAPLGAEVVKD